MCFVCVWPFFFLSLGLGFQSFYPMGRQQGENAYTYQVHTQQADYWNKVGKCLWNSMCLYFRAFRRGEFWISAVTNRVPRPLWCDFARNLSLERLPMSFWIKIISRQKVIWNVRIRIHVPGSVLVGNWLRLSEVSWWPFLAADSFYFFNSSNSVVAIFDGLRWTRLFPLCSSLKLILVISWSSLWYTGYICPSFYT